MPVVLQKMPGYALNLNLTTFPEDANSPIAPYVSGHHYFLDSTTPFFNLDTDFHQYGMGALQKLNASDAPANAMIGPNNVGNGAVQWLKLGVKPYVQNKWKQVYRLNTAGGVPPKTCAEVTVDNVQQTHIEVDYAAEYWFFI